MSEKNQSIVKTLKLGEVTYRQWHVTLMDALEALELDEFVKDFKYERAEKETPITKKEKSQIAKAKNIIRLSINGDDLESIMECSTPKEMIAELDRKYRGPGAKSGWELLREFDTVKFEGSVQGLFSKLRQLFAAFGDKGITLPHYCINSKVRALLPIEYDEMCKMVDIYNGGRPESEYMTDKQFESELLRFEREKNLKSAGTSTSLVAASKSWKNVPNDGGQSSNNTKSGNTDLASLSAVIEISDVDDRISNVSSSLSSLALVSTSSPVTFLADCGASHHVVNDRSLLTNIRQTTRRILTLSGIVNGPEQGDMPCQLFNGEKWLPMLIKDVFYIPNQPFNLIAIGKICSNDGVKEITSKNGMTIYHNDDPILVGYWSKKYLNVIELQIRIDVSSVKDIVNVAVKSMAQWHERFGHFSTKTIGKMIKENRIDGIPDSLVKDMDYCTPCKIGKITDTSHRIESDNPHVKPVVRMVGYEGQKIYRVYVPDSRHVELCSSVIFNEKPKCIVQPISPSGTSPTANDNDNEPKTVTFFGDVSDDDDSDQSGSGSDRRGPGRPIGSKNQQYQRNEERMQSLRDVPGRSIVGISSNVPGKVENLFDKIGQIFEIRKVNSQKYLGIEFTRDRSSRTICLHQRDYLEGKLKMFNMGESRKVDTPFATGTNAYEESPANDDYPYRSSDGRCINEAVEPEKSSIVYRVSPDD
ncbi:hypothetical protein HUG17_3283 [Dermatophagoides farinae]|uniref:GAG-pre-integrase domain-containing protein n=1 Tax=Dermatophagoides farinae TaxID=6954 RepID=A0A9D4SFM6_DERFA|nr:hypothetical protein HUG17_3283 [Dermatophagoides farinae]